MAFILEILWDEKYGIGNEIPQICPARSNDHSQGIVRFGSSGAAFESPVNVALTILLRLPHQGDSKAAPDDPKRTVPCANPGGGRHNKKVPFYCDVHLRDLPTLVYARFAPRGPTVTHKVLSALGHLGLLLSHPSTLPSRFCFASPIKVRTWYMSIGTISYQVEYQLN
ncbi:hypothetical protein ACOSQ2_028956 [Xanthoceras sorbifolium]